MGDRSREVYDLLREEIASGSLRPNERLVEADLAERLRVSRTPVRESIQRLANDGLVVNRRRAWFVREHLHAEIRSIYEVREALEGYAARLAAVRATPEQLQDIVVLSHEELGDDPRNEHFVDVNARFHNAVVTAAQNQMFAEMLVANRAFYFNKRIAVAYDSQEVANACAEHVALAEALARRDAAAAEHLSREHIARALELALRKVT